MAVVTINIELKRGTFQKQIYNLHCTGPLTFQLTK